MEEGVLERRTAVRHEEGRTGGFRDRFLKPCRDQIDFTSSPCHLHQRQQDISQLIWPYFPQQDECQKIYESSLRLEHEKMPQIRLRIVGEPPIYKPGDYPAASAKKRKINISRNSSAKDLVV